MSYPPQGIDKADVLANLVAVATELNAIRAKTDGLGTLTETGGTLTTDGNEQTLYVNNAPLGVFIPKSLDIDFTNQTATETVVIRQYKRMSSGGDWIKFDESDPFAGVQDPLGKTVELFPSRFGIKVTIEKTAGDAKAYPWEVFFKV